MKDDLSQGAKAFYLYTGGFTECYGLNTTKLQPTLLSCMCLQNTIFQIDVSNFAQFVAHFPTSLTGRQCKTEISL